MSGARGRGNIATPNASSEGNNTDPSNELLEQANEFLSNSPERQKSKDAEEDSKSESESEWTTVVSKSNGRNNNARQGSNKRNLYLDTSTLNMMKSSGKDHSPTAALSPMTKVIREAEKFVSERKIGTERVRVKGITVNNRRETWSLILILPITTRKKGIGNSNQNNGLRLITKRSKTSKT